MNNIIEAGRQDTVMQQSFSSELFSRWIAFIDAKEKTVQTYNRAIKTRKLEYYSYLLSCFRES